MWNVLAGLKKARMSYGLRGETLKIPVGWDLQQLRVIRIIDYEVCIASRQVVDAGNCVRLASPTTKTLWAG